MAINPSNGILDIINGTLRVSSIEIKQAGGFATAINNIARNDILLYDDQDVNTSYMPTALNGYQSSTGITRNTTLNYLEVGTAVAGGWVYWPLQLPNSIHIDFEMHATATGGVLTLSVFNTTEPNHTNYEANDGGYKIVFDNTQNQIVIYWEGVVHATASATLRSNNWRAVNINYYRGKISVSLDGKVALTHHFNENYQEFDSRYVGFSATPGTSHKVRNFVFHNSDKWRYTASSNAADISYASGNVGIGTLTPSELLDVHGNVHIAKNLYVDGNLTVTGTTTFIDTQNLSIEDPIIEVARGNADDAIDAGLVITRATSNVAVAYRGDEEELAIGYTHSSAADTDVVPISDGGLDVRVYGNLFANNIVTTANVEGVYIKGDGSQLTRVTFGQVADYGNATSNTIQFTNADMSIAATGNVQANYFLGDGSKLIGIVRTLEEATNNGNTTSNTVRFTNETTAFVANSNVGIGTATPTANLHVVGYQYINNPPAFSSSFDHSDAPLTLTHMTPTSSTAIDDPKAILHLARDGTSGETYGSKASFKMSRYEHSGTASRSRLDITITDGTYAESNVISLRGDGKVGVGTTTPSYDLDVAGDINLSGSFYQNGSLFVSSEWTTGASSLYYRSNVEVGTANLFVDATTSRVGINTSTPAYDLDVVGDINLSGSFYQNGSPFVSSEWTAGANSLYYRSNVEIGTANLFVDATTSRVGINTSTPAFSLDVGGDINLTGSFYQNGSPFVSSEWTTGANSLYYRSNVEVGTANLFVDATTSRVGINTLTPAYDLDVAGDINLSGSFYQNGSPFVSSEWTTGASSLYYRSNVEVGTANLFVDATTSRVGINTSTPAFSLDVAGDINLTGSFYQNGSPFVSSLWTSDEASLYYRSNVEVGTANLFVDATTSRVGINTSTPAYDLDVTGDINLSGSFYQNGSLFVSSEWTSSEASLYYRSNVEVGTANLFVDATTSRVGVGTSTPTETLDVRGNITHTGLVMTDGTNIDQIKVIQKTLQVTDEWMDSGIKSTDLSTGTYIIEVYDVDDGETNYDETYSGIMSWYAGTTNSTEASEIVLTSAGQSPNDNHIYLRVQRTLASDPDNLKLQIRRDVDLSSAYTYTFKFRRMI